jgi:hypothetical protein
LVRRRERRGAGQKAYKCYMQHLNGRDIFGDKETEERIILKWMFIKLDDV